MGREALWQDVSSGAQLAAGCWTNKEVANEGTGFSQEDLWQVQGDPPPWGGAGDLRKLET